MPAISGLLQGGPVSAGHLMELSEPSPTKPGQYRSVQITLDAFATWVLDMFEAANVEFRWVGSRLDFRNPNDDWTLGPDLSGPRGVPGPIPDHQWDGTRLKIQRPDGSFEPVGVDLVGPPGGLSTATADARYRRLVEKIALADITVPVSQGTPPAYPDSGWLQGPTLQDALNQIVTTLTAQIESKGKASLPIRQRFSVAEGTATAGQTQFTITGGYTPGFALAYLNGGKLVNGVEVTATDGVKVVLAAGIDALDVLEIEASVVSSVADAAPAAHTHTVEQVSGAAKTSDVAASFTATNATVETNRVNAQAALDKRVRVDGAQNFLPSEKALARQNMGAAAFNDQRVLAMLTATLKGSVAMLFSGMADGFKGTDGTDMALTSGAFVDVVGGQLVGGLGQQFVVEALPSLPIMTGNASNAIGASGYIASASSENVASQQAWNVFTQSMSGTPWIPANPTMMPAWVQLQTPSAIRIAAYALYGNSGAGYCPTAWQVRGSNDGTTWTVLDTRTGQSPTVRTVYSIPDANQGSYRYHQLYVTAQAGSGLNVGQFSLLQYTPVFESYPSLPAMIANTQTATGETGYVVTASSAVNQPPWRAFSRLPVPIPTQTAMSWDTDAGSLPQWVAMQTPNPIRVGGYALSYYHDGTNYLYVVGCQLQASNDGLAWTTLDWRTGIPVPDGRQRVIFNVPPANQGMYAYHRLVVTQVSSSVSATRVIVPEFSLLQVLTGVEAVQSLPLMTGPSAPTGNVATASNYYDINTFPAWRAFDGTMSSDSGWMLNGQGTIWHGTNGGYPGWVQRQLPTPVKALAYRIASMVNYTPYTWRLQGSNDGVTFTDLDVRVVGANAFGFTYGVNFYFKIQNPDFYVYYRFYIPAQGMTGDAYPRMGELQLLQGVTGPMDFKSVGFPAQAVPTAAAFMTLVKVAAGSITLNTNFTASISRDGGATWGTFALNQIGTYYGYAIYEASGVDLTGIGSGQSMKYRLQTVGSTLGVVIDAAALNWS